MPDNVPITPGSGANVATDDIGGAHYQRVKLDIGAEGAASGPAGNSTTPVRVDPTGTTPQPVSGTITVTGVATDAELQQKLEEGAPITGEVLEAGGSSGLGWLSSIRKMVASVRDRLPAALVGGRLDVNVGATAGLTDAQLRATAISVSGPLTDAQLRAAAVPVSGTVTASGPLTDAQLRAAAVLVDSELPAAAALADGAANPTTPTMGAAMLAFNGTTWHRVYVSVAPGSVDGVSGSASNGFDVRAGIYVFNGTTWDRIRGDTVNGMDVDVTRLPSIPAGTNAIGKLAANSGVDIGDVDVLSQTLNTDRTATGSLTAAEQSTEIDCSGAGVVGFQLTGTWVGTVTFEVTTEGTVWTTIVVMNAATVAATTSSSANGLFFGSVGGAQKVRARCSAYTSGTIAVTLRAGAGSTNGSLVLALAANNFPAYGTVAHDGGAASTSPLLMGGYASDVVPSGVSANNDATRLWLLRVGALMTAQAPHLGMIADPYTLTSKTAQYTTAQTGTALWTPAAGKRLVITQVFVQVGGTTAGTFQLWFGASADTTYTRGTDLAIIDGEYAPSATLKPATNQDGLWIASAADHILRVTDSAAINPLTVTVWGYEV